MNVSEPVRTCALENYDLAGAVERFETNCRLLTYTPKGRMLTTKEAAAVCQVKPNTMQDKRRRVGGPPFVQPVAHRGVLYPEPLLLDWIVNGLKLKSSQ